jgi:hypothetical protein
MLANRSGICIANSETGHCWRKSSVRTSFRADEDGAVGVPDEAGGLELPTRRLQAALMDPPGYRRLFPGGGR